jgi:hypothetical protein
MTILDAFCRADTTKLFDGFAAIDRGIARTVPADILTKKSLNNSWMLESFRRGAEPGGDRGGYSPAF